MPKMASQITRKWLLTARKRTHPSVERWYPFPDQTRNEPVFAWLTRGLVFITFHYYWDWNAIWQNFIWTAPYSGRGFPHHQRGPLIKCPMTHTLTFTCLMWFHYIALVTNISVKSLDGGQLFKQWLPKQFLSVLRMYFEQLLYRWHEQQRHIIKQLIGGK